MIVRVRPLSEKEDERGEGIAIEVDDDGKTVLVRKRERERESFFFTRSCNPAAKPNSTLEHPSPTKFFSL